MQYSQNLMDEYFYAKGNNIFNMDNVTIATEISDDDRHSCDFDLKFVECDFVDAMSLRPGVSIFCSCFGPDFLFGSSIGSLLKLSLLSDASIVANSGRL